MMREYTVFNVSQCEGLPDRVLTLGEIKRRNPDERDATIDEFLACSGVEIREGAGEAYYCERLSGPAYGRRKEVVATMPGRLEGCL
jgi:antirestriction protein ArdC